MPKRPADHPYGERVLQLEPKCEGLDVWELQIKLIAWGSGSDNDGIGNVLEPVAVTGTFDSRTRDAVMRFQKSHKLPVNGVVDSCVFTMIDREAAIHPVMVHDLRCPCVIGANDGPIRCRCTKHPEAGKCTGFGKARFAGKYILEGKKLADGTTLDAEKLDLYDMEEYDGIDKAVLWALRGLMHRAKVTKLGMISGYRCWEDNYHHTDDLRWHHRRLTFFLGKAIEFYHAGVCTEIGANLKAAPCAECTRIRKAGLSLCGFQLRWQEPDRVGVAEGDPKDKPPTTPYAVHVNTVRRRDREKDEFVKTFFDSVQPIYAGYTGISLPLNLGSGLDPKTALTDRFFDNIERGPGGWFPVGASRFWHPGVHLSGNAGAEVHAMADGELVGFRAGEAEDAKAYGSRNFAVIKHQIGAKGTEKDYYSLAMHLDAGKIAKDSKIRWRRLIFWRTKDHVEALQPCPFFVVYKDDANKDRLRGVRGLAPGECVEISGAEVDANTIDDRAPANSKLVKLAEQVDGAVAYVYTKLENKDIGKRYDKDDTLAGKIDGKTVGLSRPVKITAGEIVGAIGAAPVSEAGKSQGACVHLEAFSAEKIAPGVGWEDLTVDAAKIADRKALTEQLIAKKYIVEPTDKVYTDPDIRAAETDPSREALRSVILKTQNTWSLDWKAALNAPESLKFRNDLDALGDQFNEYRWWTDVKSDGGKLPGSDIVFHYHPIALILAIAHS